MAKAAIMAADSKSYEKYDIVQILIDSWKFGNKEYLPTFYLFDLEGSLLEKLPLQTSLYSKTLVDLDGKPLMIKKRRYLFNFDTKLTQLERDSIFNYSEGIKPFTISASDIEEKKE